MHNLLILGAGGHGKVVAETAELEGRWDKIAFLDDREDIKHIFNFEIIGKLNNYKDFTKQFDSVFVAIGDNKLRLQLINKLIDAGYNVPVLIHPKSSVSKYSKIGIGTVVLAGAVINTGSEVGKGCIININSCVDHDCIICDGVHVCSGATVRSMVNIGRLSYIGAGALVKSGMKVGKEYKLEDGLII